MSTNELFDHLDKGLTDDLFGEFFHTDLLDDRTSALPQVAVTEELLYQERLQSLIDSQLRDIQSFANKERKDVNEVRRSVAIHHARFLFKGAQLPSGNPVPNPSPAAGSVNPPSGSGPTQNSNPTGALKTILTTISAALQKIHSVFYLDSLLLVVSPLDQSDAWLGGSLVGRDFWRGLRGGGLPGSRAFKRASRVKYESEHGTILNSAAGGIEGAPRPNTPPPHSTSTNTFTVLSGQEGNGDSTGNSKWGAEAGSSAPTSITRVEGAIIANAMRNLKQDQNQSHGPGKADPPLLNSQATKTELNRVVRQALRDLTGIKSAEMKWTKPRTLESIYGIKLIGWPEQIPYRNPSDNTLEVNRTLLKGFVRNSIKFVRVSTPTPDIPPPERYGGYLDPPPSNSRPIPATSIQHQTQAQLRTSNLPTYSPPQSNNALNDPDDPERFNSERGSKRKRI